MKAVYYTGNKSFQLGESKRESPDADEVLLKVAFCGVCGTDVHIYHGNMDQRVSMPQVIGHEVSAEVIETGKNVDNVKPGDRVAVRPLKTGTHDPIDAGFTHIGKNTKFIGIDTPGGMQTYWTVPAYTLHTLPDTVSFEHGAMIEPLAVACHDVRLSGINPGDRCVIIGGGPIGMLVSLVAKQKGARVLISEINQYRLDLARSLGVETVHPGEENIVEKVNDWTQSAYADVVFEVSGTEAGVKVMTELVHVRGRIVMVAIHSQPRLVDLFQFFWKELQLTGVRVYEPKDFEEAIQLVASRTIPLEDLITGIAPLDDTQKIFKEIDENPHGMKYLLRCS